MLELPRVLSSKLDLPTLTMSFAVKDQYFVEVVWRAYSVNMDTQIALYTIVMDSVRPLMPCRVKNGPPVDFETYKRKVAANAVRKRS